MTDKLNGFVVNFKRKGWRKAMSNFWVKIGILGLIVLALIIAVKFYSPSKPEQTIEMRTAPEETPRPQPLQTDQTSKGQIQQQQSIPQPTQEPIQTQPQSEEDFTKNIEAERIYDMAVYESKLAKKPLFSYVGMVKYCREILERFPDTEYAEKARALLRGIPEDQRARYNITDEELGLVEK